jgi:glycosyltransferase involved in cell wall biosynthesis
MKMRKPDSGDGYTDREGLRAARDRLIELECEVAQLKEAAAELEAQNRDLHDQLTEVVSISEEIVAKAGSNVIGLRPWARVRRTATRIARACYEVARRIVGAARRLVRRDAPATEDRVELEVRFDDAVSRPVPSLALVVRTDEDPQRCALPDGLAHQTDPDLVVAMWNEDSGQAMLLRSDGVQEPAPAPDRRSLAAATKAEYLADIGRPVPTMHPTLVERCRWTLASEGLSLVVAGAGGGLNHDDLVIHPAASWIEPRNGGRRLSDMTKAVGGAGWIGSAGRERPSIGGGAGRGYLPAAGAAGRVQHTVAPLRNVVAARSPDDGCRSLLVITGVGGDELCLWVVRTLARTFDLTVLVTDGDDTSPTVRALSRVTDRVYAIGPFLEPSVWPSLAADLVRADSVDAVIRIGMSLTLEHGGPSAPLIDLPLGPGQIDDRADLVLALGRDISAAAQLRGLKTADIVPAPSPAGELPVEASVAGIRAAYGVPEGARLVLSLGELEPEQRPEDVAAVAQRLSGRDDVHILLVGGGSLAGSVSDLAGHFRLGNFSMAPLVHPAAELVAVSDCILSTAEVDPWPTTIGLALALNRPVVATEIDGVRELAAAARPERFDLCPPGDVGALAAAVERVVANADFSPVTCEAWRNAGALSGSADDVLHDAVNAAIGGG